MHVPMPVLAAAAIAVLLLAWLAFRRRRGGARNLMAPPVFPEHVHSAPNDADRFSPKTGLHSLAPEAEAEIRDLLRRRRKIEAIKRLRELSPAMSLRDAKDMVERM